MKKNIKKIITAILIIAAMISMGVYALSAYVSANTPVVAAETVEAREYKPLAKLHPIKLINKNFNTAADKEAVKSVREVYAMKDDINDLNYVDDETKDVWSAKITDLSKNAGDMDKEVFTELVEEVKNDLADMKETQRKQEEYIEGLNSVVNFDEAFTVVHTGSGASEPYKQSLIDQGYIVYDESWYLHHNWASFLKYFDRLVPGKEFILDGEVHTVVNRFHGSSSPYTFTDIVLGYEIECLNYCYMNDAGRCLPKGTGKYIITCAKGEQGSADSWGLWIVEFE